MKKTLLTIIATLIILSNIIPGTLVDPMPGYRNPLTLITWETGTVLNDKGDGIITSPFVDSYFNYISYSRTNNVKPGDNVFSVFIYNPVTLYSDDIIARFDF